MLNRRLAAIAAAALMAGTANAAGTTASSPVSEFDHAAGMNIERYVVGRADPLHRWLQQSHGALVVADEVTIEVRYFPNSGKSARAASPLQALLREIDSGRAKTNYFPLPDPPNGPAPIGAKDKTKIHCDTSRFGQSISMNGVTTFDWEYGYTVDSNGDGKKDSEPGWYITGVSFSPYSLQDATIC
jgi:hypothetical protein